MTCFPKLIEYTKEELHEQIINGEIDHDFICDYISKRDKVYNQFIDKIDELMKENKKLQEKYGIRTESYNKILLENSSLKDKNKHYQYIIEQLENHLETEVNDWKDVEDTLTRGMVQEDRNILKMIQEMKKNVE